MLRNIISASVLILVAVSFTIAQQTPPEGGTPKPFNVPANESYQLDNSMYVTLIPYGKIPKVTVRLMIQAGNVNESENQVWLADLTGNLLKEGTTSRNAEQIAQEAASMGGSVDISTGLDQSTVNGDVLSEFAPDIIALIGDIVRNPLFPESELARLKRDMVRNLSIQKSQPQAVANEKFAEVLYGDHPYGRIFPTEEMVNGYTVDEIKQFYAENISAARSHLYVSGKFNTDQVKKAIKNAFNSWPKGKEAEMLPAKPRSERAVYLIDRVDAKQSTIRMGLPVIDPSDPDYIKLQVTNSLLGGSLASRITSNIREDKGYTYSPRSSVTSRFRNAYWVQSADVTTDVTGASLREIMKEINLLQAEPPANDELKGIENYMAGIFVLRNSSRGGIISQLNYVDLHDLDEAYLKEYVDRVHAVTPEDVKNMTQKYIDDDKMIIVVAGDVKTIRQQVKEFGKVYETLK
ncbi:MAG: insulinase family protein [Deferribacteres bacterium]|nr:insulinase family protein [candidate division KSB1 bacterium]MCB9503034.1 insulinase family protein [Deferribacteres bacterium]